MEINLAPLLIEQAKLDERINKEHQVTHLKTKTERFLALLVEVGELANATRVFKYWSYKPSEERPILLDEYADGLHFFLSLALVFNYEVNSVTYTPLKQEKKVIIDAFQDVYQKVAFFMEDEQKDSYFNALGAFLSLSSALGFTSEDISDAYHAKLVVNYTRQNTKY